MKKLGLFFLISVILAINSPAYAIKFKIMPSDVSYSGPGISSPCDALPNSHGVRVPACGPGEEFAFETWFTPNAANAWQFSANWEATTDATDINQKTQFTIVAYPDGAPFDTINPAGGSSPDTDSVEDSNTGGTDLVLRESALTPSIDIFNINTDANCASTTCQGKHVRVIVERITPSANEIPGNVFYNSIVMETNP